MDISDNVTQNGSPDLRFQPLNQSQQLMPDEYLVKPLKGEPSRTFYLKDDLRKKKVRCTITQNSQATVTQSSVCRICLTQDQIALISPCKCKGSLEAVHEHCLKFWILEKYGIAQVFKNNINCEICKEKLDFKVKFVPKLQLSLVKMANRAKIICWGIETCVTLILIMAIGILVAFLCTHSEETIVFAFITVLFIFLIIMFAIVYVSCIEEMTIDVVEEWTFNNHKEQGSMKCVLMIKKPKLTIKSILQKPQSNQCSESVIINAGN